LKWVLQADFEKKYPKKKKMLSTMEKKDDVKDKDSFYPEEYEKVDRILDMLKDEEGTQYLVKWRQLPYEDSTWEYESALTSDEDKEKIKEFVELTGSLQALKKNGHKKITPPSKKVDPPTFKDPNLSLKPYQVEGFAWLALCWYKQRNCMLADGSDNDL
jgi:hypothetical protein